MNYGHNMIIKILNIEIIEIKIELESGIKHNPTPYVYDHIFPVIEIW
jgi:hypothetical protein